MPLKPDEKKALLDFEAAMAIGAGDRPKPGSRATIHTESHTKHITEEFIYVPSEEFWGVMEALGAMFALCGDGVEEPEKAVESLRNLLESVNKLREAMGDDRT